MRCEDVLNLLNARADGELPPEDVAALEAHLAECVECRVEAEAIGAVNDELRRAFAPGRDAAARLCDNTLSAVRAATIPAKATLSPAASPSRRPAWGQLLAGMAAGFLLAVTLFRPWQTANVAMKDGATRITCATVTAASAPIEVQSVVNPLDVFRCPTFGSIAENSIVRTGAEDRCELALNNGNSLRLDCNTEVKLQGADSVEVNRGRVWSTSAPGNKGVEIKLHGCPVFPKADEASRIAFECQPGSARLIVVDGEANVQTGQKSIDVGAGKQLKIADGKVQGVPEWCDVSLETAWVNSVLALSDSNHPELADRVNRLLANVGAAKLSVLYEDELRRLGDAGVPPLLAYLSSTRETPSDAKRVTAARIVADVAESRWIGDLIALLTDPNADVRVNAARGLERLTGRNQGLQSTAWQSSSWATCEPPYHQWLNWWAQNRDRYPAARRDVPTPETPPF